MATLTVRLSAELKEKLAAQCYELHTSQAEVVRRGIEAFIVYGRWWLTLEEEEEGTT